VGCRRSRSSALASCGIDLVATVLSARRWGASTRTTTDNALCMLFGLLIGLPGMIVGPFLSAVFGEFILQET
jgi:uncharacterized protein YqgC (DUF456 family)